jgi:UDP-N-acetylmuramate dehydrogenase
MSDAVLRAEAMLRAACGDRVRTRFPMAPLTTFRIGGPAALYLEAESDRDLIAAGRAVTETGLPVLVVGKGSNILVSDGGFFGLVLRLGKGFRWAARNGLQLSAGAAMPLPALAGIALRHGLAGLEFGVAIPASVGGAVRMNAGAHGHEIAEVLDRVETFGLRSGQASSIPASEASFEYRRSGLPEDAVVTACTVVLATGDAIAIRRAMDDARDWRRRTQPLAEPNCGSVFRNPPDGHAAHLIEEAGLKGRSVGGASVSMKHANFIVASPGASAADVVSLIGEVQELVERESGIRLEPEVHLVGEFDRAPR